MANVIYINGVTLKKSKFGIKFSGKAEEFIEQVRANTNEKGYFNFEINERKEVGKFGDTHFLKVDDWKPEQKSTGKITPNPDAKDDLPF